MSADARAALCEKLVQAVTGHLSSAEEAATAVMVLLSTPTVDVDVHEITTYGDARERFIWSKSATAGLTVVMESGSYERALR
jgi:hypothetical protein